MHRLAVVAAFIAGAALVATVLVVSDTTPKTQPLLSEKLAMLKNFQSAKSVKSHFLQALNTECPYKIIQSGPRADMCPVAPVGFGPEYFLQQDGCC